MDLPHLSPQALLGDHTDGKAMVRQTGKRGELAVFRKPRTPDPFVNSRLTSVGCDASGAERFWISCVTSLHGATSSLIDSQRNPVRGEVRAFVRLCLLLLSPCTVDRNAERTSLGSR